MKFRSGWGYIQAPFVNLSGKKGEKNTKCISQSSWDVKLMLKKKKKRKRTLRPRQWRSLMLEVFSYVQPFPLKLFFSLDHLRNVASGTESWRPETRSDCSWRECGLFHEPQSSNRDPQESWARVTRYKDATSKRVSSRRSEVRIFQGTERAECTQPVKVTASVPSASKSSMDASYWGAILRPSVSSVRTVCH